jgi:hypothetical protein
MCVEIHELLSTILALIGDGVATDSLVDTNDVTVIKINYIIHNFNCKLLLFDIM